MTIAEDHVAGPGTTRRPLRNWAGNVTFHPQTVVRPTTLDQLQHTVAGARRARVLGSGHSFSRLADTTGTMIDLSGLVAEPSFDARTGRVRVSGATTYGVLGRFLQRHGRALHNTGSLPHISVAGACSTGTHGSGNGNRVLPAAVTAVDLVQADGERVHLSRRDDADVFDGEVLALGLRGVLTDLELQTEATFDVRQDVWRDVPFTALAENVEQVMAAGYSVSVFTAWSRPDVVDKVWVKRRVDGPERTPPADLPGDWLGGRLADGAVHPVEGEDPRGATEQGGTPGPWNERLPHFRMEFTPSTGDEIQTEYLLDRRHAADALGALRAVADSFPGVLQVCEIRTIAADPLWLSPAFGRDSVALHFTWVNDIGRVTPVLGRIEAAIERFEPRPHWGKVFTLDEQVVRSRYPRLADFLSLVERADPGGTFGNAETERFLGVTDRRS